ncbi:MAG: zinc-ribbon domain-containing protein [Methanomassiliicoccales archaeon]|jgi:ribosomal protein L40E|nr:zinc-ribbon domain-containing protein [Methanomassiliicoccales archaeon]
MSFQEELRKRLEAFKTKKYALPAIILLTFVLSAILLLFLWYYLCFISIVIALIAYGLPKYFGLKSLKKLALFGIVLFLVLGISFGIKSYYDFTGYGGDVVSSENGFLVNGTVTPYRGNASTIYHFEVTLINGTNESRVQVNITDLWTYAPSLIVNMTPLYEVDDGYVFSTDVALWEGVFEYQFSSNGTMTYWGFGPLSVPDDVLFQQLLYTRLLIVFLQIGVLFYLFLALTWWMDTSKARREQLRKEREEKGKSGDKKAPEKEGEAGRTDKGKLVEKFVCSECGAEVPPDAKKCPQCGERFEDEEEEMICANCGAKVKHSDEKCWNCGKEFNN